MVKIPLGCSIGKESTGEMKINVFSRLGLYSLLCPLHQEGRTIIGAHLNLKG